MAVKSEEKPKKEKKTVKKEKAVKEKHEPAEISEKKPKKPKKEAQQSGPHEFSDEEIQRSAEIESGQPEVNIELIGHVDHGKTTLTEALTGKWTDTHSEELKRGITIRLGYADSTFYKYPDGSYGTAPDASSGKGVAVRKVSFVDAPGHESLMATMLSGMTIIDGALLLVAANEYCPQPQTREHLMALQIVGIKNVIVVQNKVDLVPEDRALRNYKQIKEFLKDTAYKDAPIIPISAQHKANIDALIKAIQDVIKTPERNANVDSLMFIARSFDINKPGTDIEKLSGGVFGGAVIRGVLKQGDAVEIRPGRITEEQNQLVAKPLFTKIVSAVTGGKSVAVLKPGGSVAVQVELDPAIVKSDKLSGNCVGLPGKLPDIRYELNLDVHLLERVVGSTEDIKVEPIKKLEALMLNVNSAATVGVVIELHKNIIKCKLKLPVCADKGSRVTISRRIGTRFRLIGYGVIQ
ncbi:MAG: translation initiation factor IF-2 subunit gamma [Candidatus Woesearchaeota archaeon]